MSYDHGNSIFALVTYNLMQLRFLFRSLARFRHERLVLILKHSTASWLVMSGVRKYKKPLRYVLQYIWLIGVNEGNE
jgi:hypothetical protein